MDTNRKTIILFGLVIIITISIMVLFILPIISCIFADGTTIQLFNDNSNGLKSSLYRSIIFAVLSSLLCVIGGLFFAIQLSNISFHSKFGRILSLFMLPMTLGNVTIAYIFKIILFNTCFFDNIIKSGTIAQFSLLLSLQLWHYLFLFSYLFWIGIQNIPKNLTTYSSIIKHTQLEYIKDIILPNVKSLFILLFFIGFVFSFYENSNSLFILKCSQGTNTELISQSLNRIYYSNLSIDPAFASLSIFKSGIVISFIILIMLSVFGGLLAFVISKIVKHQGTFKIGARFTTRKFTSYINIIGCVLLILIPILIALINSQYHFSLTTLIEPALAFFLTIIAAIAATISAISLGISLKIIFKKILIGFNFKSLIFLLILFLFQLIPPLCIVLCAFETFAVIGYKFDILIYLIWIMGHCLLTLPILGSFILITHFAVKKDELDYLNVYKIPISRIIKYSFIKRFRIEYILTFIFAFIFIWNDTSLNMILSDRIPSFAKNLEMLFTGKGTNYSQATLYVFIALTLAIICIFVWQYVINKVVNNKKNEIDKI